MQQENKKLTIKNPKDFKDKSTSKSKEKESEKLPPIRKTIYNPATKTRYSIRQRSTVAGRKGTIKGKFSRG